MSKKSIPGGRGGSGGAVSTLGLLGGTGGGDAIRAGQKRKTDHEENKRMQL